MVAIESLAKYSAILIDPPWRFRVWNRDTGMGRSAESHYRTMSLDDIKRLPVQAIMADDCAVFMWATFPMLPEALALGEAWGLEYKTCAFLWAKTNKGLAGSFGVIESDANWFMGMGYWTRANTEPCLLFTRGRPKRKSRSVRQFVASVIRQHSQKPIEVYARIESLVDGPYLELFARNNHPGWISVGNEIDGRDIGDAIGITRQQQQESFGE